MHLIGGETHAQNQHNVNWHAMQFVMQANDTIYAARTGTVVEIKEMEPESNAAAQPAGHTTFRRNVNRITVEHEDETYANYSVVENIQVSLGDKVFPMTPLGIAGTYDGENYQTRLMFYYYRIAPQKKNGQTTFEFHYFRPVFATTAGEMPLTMNQNYFPLVSTELITKEMSKREARRYQGK
jgi:Peptidase family M23.